MIVLPSIRHTGTRFMRDLLKRQEFISRHIGEKFLDDLEPHINNNIIIPMRKLNKVIHSWEKRQLNLNELHSAFSILADRYHDRAFYLPIDADDRDERLKALNAKFGLDLTTDWTLIGTAQDHTSEKDLEAAKRLYDDFSWLFIEIYGRN